MSNHSKGFIWPWKDRGVRDLEPLFAQKNITFLSTQLHALRLFSKINKTKLYLILYLFPLRHTSLSFFISIYLANWQKIVLIIFNVINSFAINIPFKTVHLFSYSLSVPSRPAPPRHGTLEHTTLLCNRYIKQYCSRQSVLEGHRLNI